MIETEWQEGQIVFWAKQEIDNPFEPPTRSVELAHVQWRIYLSSSEVSIEFRDAKTIKVEKCPINNNTWDGWALLDPDGGTCLHYKQIPFPANSTFELITHQRSHGGL